jgi:glucose-1-phosphate thymidylyltransferase
MGHHPHPRTSARGQYEITDVNNTYLERGLLTCDILPYEWSDAGTPESLFRATCIARECGFVPQVNLRDDPCAMK